MISKIMKMSLLVTFSICLLLTACSATNDTSVAESNNKPTPYQQLLAKPLTIAKHQFKPIVYATKSDVKSGLVHPGILTNSFELNALAKELTHGTPVNLALWQHLIDSPYSNPKKDAWRPKKNWQGIDWLDSSKYYSTIIADTLRWAMEQDQQAQARAIDMLNAWADIDSFALDLTLSTRKERLYGGIKFGFLAYAAELLMHSNTAWPQGEQDKFKQTMRRIYLPIIDSNRPNFYNGNWDLAATWSSLAISVLLDDRELFDQNISRLKSNDLTNGSIYNYLLPSGQNAETGRDQTHPQMGLYFMALSAQIAWNQGIDLFELEGRSIGRSFEYLAKYKLGSDDVPYQRFPSPLYPLYGDALNDVTRPNDKRREDFAPVYQMVYAHYKYYRNTELTYVKKILQRYFPEGPGSQSSNYSSATWGNIDVSDYARQRGAKPANVTVASIQDQPERVVLINVGSSKENKLVTDQQGGVFVSDQRGVSGGYLRHRKSQQSVEGASTPALYTYYRESDAHLGLAYYFPLVTQGSYTLKLHFVEHEKTAANQRLFNLVFGSDYTKYTKPTTIDIFEKVGVNQLYVLEQQVNVDNEGFHFTLHPLKGTAILSAIELIKL